MKTLRNKKKPHTRYIGILSTTPPPPHPPDISVNKNTHSHKRGCVRIFFFLSRHHCLRRHKTCSPMIFFPLFVTAARLYCVRWQPLLRQDEIVLRAFTRWPSRRNRIKVRACAPTDIYQHCSLQSRNTCDTMTSDIIR